MKGEIATEGYYCIIAANSKNFKILCPTPGKHYETCKEDHLTCPFACLKYPTPKQFKHEYGEEYPEYGAVYYKRTVSLKKGRLEEEWDVTTYKIAQESWSGIDVDKVVCACTPFGYPPL